ncbi:c-type cytochrome [Oleiharenicola sp. Vm1]|uniref:c-type cytochrome n=1 Tax=Oleiharenicola sp. Vm1 TaxID=3398393 RepID=UPI0039F575ED
MTKTLLLTASLLAAATGAFAESNEAVVARGRYLVENVAGCGDCHSPRDPRGQIPAGQHLMGTPLPFAPTVPMPAWAAQAPQIAGLPGYTDAQAVTLFTQGTKPDGSMPRPPMPQFRFTAEDARAVVAYLRSLKK